MKRHDNNTMLLQMYTSSEQPDLIELPDVAIFLQTSLPISLVSSPSGNLDRYEERMSAHREGPKEMALTGESPGSGAQQPHRNSISEEASRERRSPNNPDYPYKKSAL